MTSHYLIQWWPDSLMHIYATLAVGGDELNDELITVWSLYSIFPYSWKTITHLIYTVNTMASDGLVTQGARTSVALILTYSQVSNVRCTLVACRHCSKYIFILHLTLGFNILGKCNCMPRWGTFKFWCLVHLILEILWLFTYYNLSLMVRVRKSQKNMGIY